MQIKDMMTCDTYKQAVTKWNEMTKGKTND